jgi:hypothetical protein
MAKVGKMTIYVEQGFNTQVVRIRTTGVVGSIPLNTITADQAYAFKTSAPDAKTFWEAINALVGEILPTL